MLPVECNAGAAEMERATRLHCVTHFLFHGHLPGQSDLFLDFDLCVSRRDSPGRLLDWGRSEYRCMRPRNIRLRLSARPSVRRGSCESRLVSQSVHCLFLLLSTLVLKPSHGAAVSSGLKSANEWGLWMGRDRAWGPSWVTWVGPGPSRGGPATLEFAAAGGGACSAINKSNLTSKLLSYWNFRFGFD